MPESLKIIELANKQRGEAEKNPDFAELQKQKEELFRKIEQESHKLDIHDKYLLVSRMLGYSVKDGFEMAKKLGADLMSPLMTVDYVEKNKKFASAFTDFISNNGLAYLYEEDANECIRLGQISLGVSSPIKDVARDATPFMAEIDEYYENFIRNRRFESPDLPKDDRTQVEKTAEEHLASAEAILRESYYTGSIRKFLGIETEEKLEKSDSYSDIEKNYFRSDFIDRNTLNSLHNQTFPDKFQDAKVKKLLREARYAPSVAVFETRKKEAEKGLMEQIKQSLIKRGYKENEFEIKLNGSTGEYEVVEKKEDGETGEKKLREIKSVPAKIVELQTNNEFRLLYPKIINEKVYSVYYDDISNKSIIEYPDSQTTDLLDGSNLVLQRVGNHTSFLKHLDAGWAHIVDGRPLVCDGYEAFGKEIVEISGHLYWIAKDVATDGVVVIEDDHKKSLFGFPEVKGELAEIEGKLTYIYVADDKHLNLAFGGENFGPYDEIKLCENSKDKLIFYARKGDEHFVHVDGKTEKTNLISRESGVNKVVQGNNKIAILTEATIVWPEIKGIQSWVLRNTEKISNFSEINNKLFYLSKELGMPECYYANWAGHAIKINISNLEVQTVGLNDSVFVADGKRVLSLKYGAQEFNEMNFDGEVEVVNSGGKLFIIESLDDKKRIWEYSEKLELQEREQKNLDLANAVAKEDLPTIDDYFGKYYPETLGNKPNFGHIGFPDLSNWLEMDNFKDKIKGGVEQSKSFVRAVNQTIKEAPELFLDTLRAKNDKPTEFLMTQMFYYMFPEAQAKREKALKEARENPGNPWSVFGGMEDGQGRSAKEKSYDYDPGENHLASMDEAGYYEMLNSKREVLKLREPLPAGTFITSGIFGNYNGSGWSKVNVPISREVRDPAEETTFEFVDEEASPNINLPRIANAKIITDRLKGVTAEGEEMPIEILEENNLGEVRVKKDKGMKHIAYSQNYSEAPKTMAEITAEDYVKFRKSFEKSFGDVMTKPIGDIGDELNIFLAGLRDKTPREQVIAIQEFCYEYGYYNLDNQPRDTDSFEERLAIMEGRMDELKAKEPKLARKKYAGICTDFATLCAGLLRRAGFISGIASGFATEAGSTSISTDRAHAVSFVLWPNPENKEGKPDLIIVDGTPSSITPKIIEQEKMAAGMSQELSVDAEKELAELENILKTMDVEEIKKLENGQLEKTLNHILYGVRQSHVDVMNRVLNASRYAGFDISKMVNGDMDSEIEFRKLLEREITSERSGAHENRERRGEELFNLILEFSERFKKDKNIKGKKETFDVLEKVFAIAEKYFDPIEKRSAAAIITYLRAKKISS